VNRILWLFQILLAALFLFAGGVKLVLPIEAMTQQIHLPGWFLRFIGICEVLGALGLVLPGVFRIWIFLTPLAAVGLVIIMIGATVVSLISGPAALALIPFFTGVCAAFVAYARLKLKRLK